jgi:hypothetical protein
LIHDWLAQALWLTGAPTGGLHVQPDVSSPSFCANSPNDPARAMLGTIIATLNLSLWPLRRIWPEGQQTFFPFGIAFAKSEIPRVRSWYRRVAHRQSIIAT